MKGKSPDCEEDYVTTDQLVLVSQQQPITSFQVTEDGITLETTEYHNVDESSRIESSDYRRNLRIS